MSKQNYRHQKKQKEHARKARQVEKQQRRQTRTTAPGADDGTPAAEAPPGASIPEPRPPESDH